MKAVVIAGLIALSGGTAHAQQVLAEIEGVVVTSTAPADSSFACSNQADSTILAMVVGYVTGYERGLLGGAAGMHFFLNGANTALDLETADRATAFWELPDLRYGAYSSETKGLCNRYPTADVREAIAAAASKIHSTMARGSRN